MPLRVYKHRKSGGVVRSLSSLDPKDWEELLSAPETKFMVPANKATGTSKVKDLKPILTARSRNYARENDLDDQAAVSNANGMEHMTRRNLLDENGLRRTKLSDL